MKGPYRTRRAGTTTASAHAEIMETTAVSAVYTGVRRPRPSSLVLGLVRRHRSSYLVMLLATLAASTLSSGWIQAAFSIGHRDGAPPAGQLNTYERLIQAGGEDAARQMAVMAAVICAFISIILVISSVGFLIETRRREYAMFRLAGASPRRVRRLALGEFMVPLAVADLAGSLSGCLLSGAFVKVILDSGIYGVRLAGRPNLAGTLIAFVSLMAACLVGVWFAARRIGSVSPIEALNPSGRTAAKKKIGPVRILLALAGLTGGMVLVLAPVDGMDVETRILTSTACLLTAVAALAPLLVTAVGSVIGLPLQLVTRGSGLLARQRARRESRASGAIALPVILMLVIMSGILTLARAGWTSQTVSQYAPVQAEIIVTADADAAGALDRTLVTSPDVDSAVTYRSEDWQVSGPDVDRNSTTILTMVPLRGQTPGARPADTIMPTFIKGSPGDLGPGRVAVTRQWAQNNLEGKEPLGQTLTLTGKDDKPQRFTVAAVVDMAPTGQFSQLVMGPESGLQIEPPQTKGLTTLVRLKTGSNPGRASRDLDSRLKRDPTASGARARTRREHMDYDARRSAHVQQGLPRMTAGAAVLASIFLVQSCAVVASERRLQNSRLRDVGVSRRPLAMASIWESAIDVLAATVLAALVMLTVIWGTYRQMDTALAGIRIPLPYGYFFGMALVGLAAAMLTSGLYTWISSQPNRSGQ